MQTARWVAVLIFLFALPALPREPVDPLATEIARWSDALKNRKSSDETWQQMKETSAPYITGAETALAAGQRGLALYQLARTRLYLAGAELVGKLSASQRNDMAALEAAWKRSGRTLAPDLSPPSATTLARVSPAIVRAVAEIAYPQVHNYYFASLDFARNTNAESGFYYLGLAHGQEELLSLCRSMSAGSAGAASPPPLRSLALELDALEKELAAAYRPPAAIDRHRDFIAAAGVLKEARELDGAGMRHGALLRYLQTVDRVAQLRPDRPRLDADGLQALEARLADASVDHSIARMLLELARTGPPEALAITASEVLPRYFAALEPPKPAPPAAAPEVTVTMVRWPYT